MFELQKTGGMRHGKEGIRLVPGAKFRSKFRKWEKKPGRNVEAHSRIEKRRRLSTELIPLETFGFRDILG